MTKKDGDADQPSAARPEARRNFHRLLKILHWLRRHAAPRVMEWWNPILKAPLEAREGMAHAAPPAPGSGVEFNEEAVQRYLA